MLHFLQGFHFLHDPNLNICFIAGHLYTKTHCLWSGTVLSEQCLHTHTHPSSVSCGGAEVHCGHFHEGNTLERRVQSSGSTRCWVGTSARPRGSWWNVAEDKASEVRGEGLPEPPLFSAQSTAARPSANYSNHPSNNNQIKQLIIKSVWSMSIPSSLHLDLFLLEPSLSRVHIFPTAGCTAAACCPLPDPKTVWATLRHALVTVRLLVPKACHVNSLWPPHPPTATSSSTSNVVPFLSFGDGRGRCWRRISLQLVAAKTKQSFQVCSNHPRQPTGNQIKTFLYFPDMPPHPTLG